MSVLIIGYGRIGRFWHDLIGDENVFEIVDPYIKDNDRVVDVVSPEAWCMCDRAIICSPTALHVEHVIKCLDHKLHVLCEKPLSLEADEINKCFSRAKEVQRHLLVGLNRRWDTLLEARLKQPVTPVNTDFVSMCRDYPTPTEEFLKQSGGVFHDCLIHEMDIAGFFCGFDLNELVVNEIDCGDIEPRPDSCFLKHAVVRCKQEFQGQKQQPLERTLTMDFGRTSETETYVHSIKYGGDTATACQTLPKHSTFMDRFTDAFRCMYHTFDRLVAGTATDAEKNKIPTAAQLVALLNAIARIEEKYQS